MEGKKIEDYWIQDDSLLIDPIDDYFSKQGDFMIHTDINYSVGSIVHVGKDWSSDVVGRVCYYHKNIGTMINLKEKGKYTLITKNTLLIIKPEL